MSRLIPALVAAGCASAVAASPASAFPAEYRQPPVNPSHAQSPWPIYHQNSYMQASTSLRGPEIGDALNAQQIDIPAGAGVTLDASLGNTSPWTQLSEAYADGCRAGFHSGTAQVYKTRICGTSVSFVNGISFRSITGNASDADPSVLDTGGRWANLLARGNELIVPDPPNRKIYVFGDLGTPSSDAPLVLKRTFTVPSDMGGFVAMPNLTYDGRMTFVTEDGWVGAVRFSDFGDLKRVRLSGVTERPHNNYPVDEQGGMYFVYADKMIKVRWTGTQLVEEWRTPYDSTNRRTLNGGSGSGTTPTLLGMSQDPDHLVTIVDAKTPSNLVAFWRGAIPADWPGLPGRDRRIAAVFPLPAADGATTRWSVENSHVARGYDTAVARYNGLHPGCDTVGGVQKMRWNPATNSFSLQWSTTAYNVNGVLTYSQGSDLLYGVGQQGCDAVLRAIDWNTGAVRFSKVLGPERDGWTDGGANLVVNSDRSITYGANGDSVVRIRP